MGNLSAGLTAIIQATLFMCNSKTGYAMNEMHLPSIFPYLKNYLRNLPPPSPNGTAMLCKLFSPVPLDGNVWLSHLFLTIIQSQKYDIAQMKLRIIFLELSAFVLQHASSLKKKINIKKNRFVTSCIPKGQF